MPRRLSFFVVLLAVFGACGGSDEPAVGMSDDHAFEPATVAVAPGTEVVFTNDSDEAHTVTAYEDSVPDDAGYFSSGDLWSEAKARDEVAQALIPPGADYSVTLETPGTYQYFCIPHEQDGMKGEIVVEE